VLRQAFQKFGLSNEISVIAYINTAFYYLPFFEVDLSQSIVNYSLMALFTLNGILFSRNIRFKVDLSWVVLAIMVFLYVFLGITFAIPYENQYLEAIKKATIIFFTAIFGLFVLYPKISLGYIEAVIRSVTLCGVLIISVAAYYNFNDWNLGSHSSSDRGVFAGFGHGNIYIIMGLFLSYIILYGWHNVGSWSKFLACASVAMFLLISLDNSLRVNYYFLLGNIIILCYLPQRKLMPALVSVTCIGFLLIVSDISWQYDYLLSKTMLESRIDFFRDALLIKGDYFSGFGFAALPFWVGLYPYTPLDINSSFILVLELGVFGLILYIFLIVFLVRVVILLKRLGCSSRIVHFFAIGIMFSLTPNIGPIAQTGVLEFYIQFFYLIAGCKFMSRLNFHGCARNTWLLCGK
jgi:hypothetical protein